MRASRPRYGSAARTALTCSTIPLLLACNGDAVPTAPADPEATPATAQVEEVVASLGSWDDFSPRLEDADMATGPQVTVDEVVDNTTYECRETPRSMRRTPREIVMYEPNASIMWVGNLLQGESYASGQGSFQELSIRQRAPLRISIDLLTDGNSAVVENPSLSTVQAAIGELIQRAHDSGHRSGSSISFSTVRMHSAFEAMMKLGLSASLVGKGVPLKLSGESERRLSAEMTAVLAHFTQKMFTISIELPQSPGAFFSDELTPELLQQQIDAGAIGPDNLPVYIASITYGRILTYSMVAAELEARMKSAVEASFTLKGIPVGGTAETELKALLEASTLRAVSIGGEGQNVIDLIREADLSAYFTEDAALTSARPISYQLNYLGDNSIASVTESTSYTLRECEEKVAASGVFDFLDGQAVATGISTPYEVRKADLDGDGHMDLVLSHLVSGENQTVVGLGGEDGSFTFGPLIAHPKTAPEGWSDGYDVLVGDFDGDGRDDLAWNRRQNGEANRLYVARSDGSGGFDFLPPQELGGNWGTGWETQVGDLDGDGDSDLVFNFRNSANNYTMLGFSQGDGTFELGASRVDHPVTGNWASYRLFVGDVDGGTRRADLVWNRLAGTEPNSLWVGLSDGSSVNLLGARQDFLSGWTGYVGHLGELNGDGARDMIWTRGTAGSLAVHRALGGPGGTFTLVGDVVSVSRPADWSNEAIGVLGDFNGDGRSDVLFNHLTATGNRMLVGAGRSTGDIEFSSSEELHPITGVDWTGLASSVFTGDVTGDGYDEVVWVAPEATTKIYVATPR